MLSSGDALLRLYRATGDVALLELLRDTVHNLAQYLPETAAPAESRRAREDPRCAPAPTAAAGSSPASAASRTDGVFDAIGLLSYTEVPGIYARVDTGFVFVFDHLTARIKERTRGRLVLAVANPTKRGRDGSHPVGDGGRRRRAAAPGRRARRADGGRAGGGDDPGERAAAVTASPTVSALRGARGKTPR